MKRREGRGLWLRLFLLCLSLLLPLTLQAQSALVLIQHDQAGPILPSADYIQAEWILWPADQEGWNNRILSLATGLDLQGEPSDTAFSAFGGGWVLDNGPSLRRRGAFDARAAYLGPTPTTVVRKEKGGVSRSVFLLALADARTVVVPRPFSDPLPTEGLVVYEASGWDDAMAIARRAGRTLIVEYPPAGEDRWSRFWQWGDWPPGVPREKDLGIPGLVRSRQALAMLLRPTEFVWQPNNAGRWGGANRWLEHGRTTTPGVLLAWYCGGLFVLAWALAQVMNEDRGPFVSELLVLLALSPASIVLAGAGARLGGLEAWPILLVLAGLALYAASLLGGLIVRQTMPDAHPLFAPCAVGLVAMLLCDPLWSDFSGRFARLDLDVPGDALGAFLAYLAGVVAFARGRWLGRAVVAAILLAGVALRPWWVGGHPALLVLPAVALIAAEGLFRPLLLGVLALLPTGLARIARDGVDWHPWGLLATAQGAGSLNLWQSATLLFSPAWMGFLVALAGGLLVGNRFLAYRLRKILRLDPRLRVLPWMALGTLALGLTEPLALPAVPVVAFGAILTLAYDGLRANA